MQQASDNREGEALSRQEITGEGDLILTPNFPMSAEVMISLGELYSLSAE